MNIVAFGGGTDSSAMIIGLYRRSIPIDLILFADTGGEQPHTIAFLKEMDDWLENHWLPKITVVEYSDQNGDRLTLEDECLRSKTLPSLAYGFKGCSLKHKIGPQEKYCNHDPRCLAAWAHGEKVIKFIGYDAGEERRRTHALAYDIQDTKYKHEYPLIDWDWYREDCIEAIRSEGLTLPGKSSCFFCPAMKKREIQQLKRKHPDLLERALALEANAVENLKTVRGLGRDWSWKEFIEADQNQMALCDAFAESSMPCGCFDGDD